MADNVEQQYGDYASNVSKTYATTPRMSLAKLANNMAYAAGCSKTSCTQYNATEVKSAAQGADLIIICLGTGMDKQHYALENQLLLICNY